MAWGDEKIKEAHKELVERIIRDMEEGKVFFWDNQHYGHPPRNIKQRTDKGHVGQDRRYHGKNIMILTYAAMKNGYRDSRWGTYKAIQEAGGQVRKGEKHTLIECWIWDKPVKHKNPKTGRWETVYQKDEDGNYLLDKNGKKKPLMKHLDQPIVKPIYVFNAEQADGLPKEHIVTIDEKDRNEKLEGILKNSEAKIFHDQQNMNYYAPVEDEIHIMHREDFKKLDAYYATAIHEISHSTGHESRLNRNTLTDGRSGGIEGYAKEELCAEMASMFIAQEYGIQFDDDHYKNHAAYLHSWIKALKDNPDELYKAAENAEKAVEYIKEHMLEKGLALGTETSMNVAEKPPKDYEITPVHTLTEEEHLSPKEALLKGMQEEKTLEKAM